VTPLILFALLLQAPQTYTIGGTVEDSVTGAPVAKAHVIIAGAITAMGTPAASRTVITGTDGRFYFDGLRVQKYTLTAERPGYATQAFGQRALYQQFSTAIMTGEGQATDNLVFRLIPSAVITGTVTDTRGDPVPGMMVVALQVSGSGARRRIVRMAPSSTDDRGYYRIPSLPAGTYAVVVSGQPFKGLPVASVDEVAYPRTFYPGTTDPEQAQFMPVKAGQEARGDLVLRPVPSGRIIGTAPNLPAGKQVYAFLDASTLLHGEINVMPSVWVAGGQFRFENVPAGKYSVYLMDDASHISGAADVVVNGAGDTSVTMSDALFPQVSVHVSVTGEPKYPNTTCLVALVPVEEMQSTIAPVGTDGDAVIPQVRPGKYEVTVAQGPRLAITSMRVRGAIAAGQMVDIPETGPVEIELAVDAAAQDLPGRVTAESRSQPGVIVMLVQRDGWQYTASYRFDQTDSDGTFRWQSVPKGEYLMFAFDRGLFEDYDDPQTIRRLLPIAQPVTVTGEAGQSVELKLLPMPADN
jgi:hypothetical protein